MSDAFLKLGFNTPFAEQIAFLKQKLNLPTERWDDIQRGAHDKAFIVAGAMKADLLNDLHDSINKVASQGKSISWFRDNFANIVQKNGWTGWTGEGTKAGEAWRTKVIYQTNLATSYAAGRYQQLTDHELLKLRPYWRYKHADGVANPRLQHVAWNGLTLPHDHPFWKTHFPPNGWGCHCRVAAVNAREYEKSKAAGDTDPPDGWDEIDPKSGAPVGIAKGFDYQPGASLVDTMEKFIEEKQARLSAPLADDFSADVASVMAKRKSLVAAIREIGAGIADEAVEHLVLLDRAGNLLERQIGSDSMVQLSPATLSKLENAILIHNHPGIPQSFSLDDMRLAVWHQLKETHVIDRLYRYEIVRPAGVIWGKDYWGQTLAPVISRIQSDVIQRLTAAESTDLINEEMRIALTDHMICEEVNAEVNIGYRRTLRKNNEK